MTFARLEGGCGWDYSACMTSAPSKRLNAQDWLQTGFQALLQDGPEALKAEPLARRLGATKGSFYWHFADVPAYHAALLAQWETQAITDIVNALADEYTDVGRLRRMGQVIAQKGASDQMGLTAEPAIRAWAKGNAKAFETVARVDAKRLAYLGDLLYKTGIGNAEMARIIYAASIGMEELDDSDADRNGDAMGSLVDLVLALR
ncbi:Bacterial regulatory proteins, tetR family [Roseovarius litorisediminis]|uniref:Bacterial regulatory proteins, tetR family n=1 Tax=Roseovarius litorisediminis TaxID=1312363 RepID=A0A1Y5T9D5_9RHOB|nr:TetR/AcrR family transcriptional regulator [Roseovarius litorisediminis]SLN58553.1 Bacterial regulatory proteins, tetR family [Roseovarius litorisediminis]